MLVSILANLGLAWLIVPFSQNAQGAARQFPEPFKRRQEPSEDVSRLIEQLGARDVETREAADANLLKLGEKARRSLREALIHPDLEIRSRAESILKGINRRAVLERIVKEGKTVTCRADSGQTGCFPDGLGKPLPHEEPTGTLLYFITLESNYRKEDCCLHSLDLKTRKELWVKKIGKDVWEAPVVVGGGVLLGGTDQIIYALNARTGEELWKTATDDHLGSSPVFSHGEVYVGSYDSRLYALNAGTGAVSRQVSFGQPIGGSPLVVGETVYVGSHNRCVYALDRKTGREKWKAATGGHVLTDPVHHEGIVYFASWDGFLYAVDGRTGERRWSVKTGKGFSAPGVVPPGGGQQDSEGKEGVICAPAVYDGVIYAPTTSGACYAWEARTGRQLWKTEVDCDVRRSPAVSGRSLYFGSTKPPRVYALDAKNGRELWQFKSEGEVFYSPTVYGEMVLCGTQKGYLYALDAATGKDLWRIKAGGSVGSPVVSD